jgi:hypothetical protein
VRVDDPQDGTKRVWWEPKGLSTKRAPLYGSERLREGDGLPALVVEGEKAADALGKFLGDRAHVLGTVCGADTVPDSDLLEPLRGRTVTLWADNDEKGRRHMARIGAMLEGLASEVRLFDWRDAPPKGDAADHPAVTGDGNDGTTADLLFRDLTEAPLVAHDGNDGMTAVPAAAPFPTSALPDALRRLVEEAAESIVCPLDLVAVPALVVLASAIGNARILRVKGGWEEPPLLFAVAVATPGAKKSPAAKEAGRPAHKEQRGLQKDYQSKRAEYERAMLQHEKDKRDCRKSGLADPAPPEEPAMERTVAADTTVEALLAVLSENPRGLAVLVDELAGWFKGHDQYKSKGGNDRQAWLSLWSCSPVTVDRKGSKEPLILQRPFACLFGTIQPAVLPELAAGRDDGLMDRFLLAYPDDVLSRYSDAEVSEEARAEYRELYRMLRALEMGEDEYGDPEPRAVVFAPDAKELFVGWLDAHNAEPEAPGFPERLRGPWAKLEAYFARLTLLVCLCRAVTNGEPERVETGDVMRAYALLDYFKAHARKVYVGLHGEDDLDRLARDVAAFLEERGGRFEGTAEALHQQLDSAYSRYDVAEFSRYQLNALAKRGAFALKRDRSAKERTLTLTLKTAVMPSLPSLPS